MHGAPMASSPLLLAHGCRLPGTLFETFARALAQAAAGVAAGHGEIFEALDGDEMLETGCSSSATTSGSPLASLVQDGREAPEEAEEAAAGEEGWVLVSGSSVEALAVGPEWGLVK